jgi:murein DD-endopeptidase MepM/ murein hydrolase activator NlpD
VKRELLERRSLRIILACLFLVLVFTNIGRAKDPPAVTTVRYPLEGSWSPLTQDFGNWSGNPKIGEKYPGTCSGYHLGEDIARSDGTRVYPMADGIVRYADVVLGYTVVIEHNIDGEYVTSVYYHMKPPEKGGIKLTPGQSVFSAEPIGYISRRPQDHGYTIPHLHFGIRKGRYKPGKDLRTGFWYYPGYTTIKGDCNKHNPLHQEILAEWYNPVTDEKNGKGFINIHLPPPPSQEITTFTAGWNLFSVPLDPAEPDPMAVLCDDLSPCKKVWEWDPTIEEYINPPNIEPGHAYWIKVDKDTLVDAQGSLIEERSFEIELWKGWNMIGQPYNFAVKLLDFRVWKSFPEGWISLSSAAQKGYLRKWAYFFYKSGSDLGWYAINLVDKRVYLTIWDPVNKKYGPWRRQSFNADQVTLNPWSGVLLRSYIDGWLSIPATPTTLFPLGISHRSRSGEAILALSAELPYPLPPLPFFPAEEIELKVFEVQAFPNPVTDENIVAFTVQGEGIRDIRIEIYDLSGRQVFDSGFVMNGFQWNLQSNEGRIVANGIYLYLVRVRGFNGEVFMSQVKKLVILR